MIGPDNSMKILDWIRIAKISDLFNIITRVKCNERIRQHGYR